MKKYIKFKKVDLRKYGKYLKINNYNDVINFYELKLIKDEKLLAKKKKAFRLQRIKGQKLFADKKEKLSLIKSKTEKRLIKINSMLPVLFHHGKNKLFKKLYNEVILTIRNFNKYDLFFEMYYNKRDYLRLTDQGNIITSQNVVISKMDALKFYHGIKKGKIQVGDRVNDFWVKNVNDTYITIGCHIIDIKEIDYIYNQLLKRDIK